MVHFVEGSCILIELTALLQDFHLTGMSVILDCSFASYCACKLRQELAPLCNDN